MNSRQKTMLVLMGLIAGSIIYFSVSDPRMLREFLPVSDKYAEDPGFPPVDPSTRQAALPRLADCNPLRTPSDTLALLQQLNAAMESAVGYLEQAALFNGQFVYRVHMNPELTPKPRYNMLRHAGTLYALVDYYQFSGDSQIFPILQNSIDFMLRHTVLPVPNQDHMSAVWSLPSITGDDSQRVLKLGGTGLALAALAEFYRLFPDLLDIDQLKSMGNFILFMQKETGEFHSKYDPDSGYNTQWKSLYYPGEAVLGLTRLYGIDRDPRWLKAAVSGLRHLARTRAGSARVPADHWALIATTELMPHLNGELQQDDEVLLLRHAIQICHSILREIPAHPVGSDLRGCFTNDGKTSPTATRLEGLLAALRIIPWQMTDIRQNILREIDDGICFLLRAQVREGEYAGGMTRAMKPLLPGQSGYSREFNARAGEIRIDYVQHALSAFLQYNLILNGRKLNAW